MIPGSTTIEYERGLTDGSRAKHSDTPMYKPSATNSDNYTDGYETGYRRADPLNNASKTLERIRFLECRKVRVKE